MLPPISRRGRPAQDVGDQRGGGRFAVGAGDPDDLVRRELRPRAAEQLDVADDLDAALPAPLHRPVRLGWVAARRAPARAREARQSACRGRRRRSPSRAACVHAAALSSQATTSAPPGQQRQRASRARAAEPEHATVLPAKVVTGVMQVSATALLSTRSCAPRRTCLRKPVRDRATAGDCSSEGVGDNITAASASTGRPARG